MAEYTVLGAGGYIGAALVRHLRARGHACHAVGRGDPMPRRPGHVVYCIGMTFDFRTRPFDTIEAHVSALANILRTAEFESLTYLSSTRVYLRCPPDVVADEDAPLIVNPMDPDDLYNLSKLTGEALCLAIPNPAIRVVRLSNVYGGANPSESFLPIILRQLLSMGKATFFNTMRSRKDYIFIEDVVEALEILPLRAKSRIINLASGCNVTNRELSDLIKREVGIPVDLSDNATDLIFPPLSMRRLKDEIGVVPGRLSDRLPELVADFRRALQE
jgi:nucleoside-diphosphate-sugar epimerase